MEKITPLEAFRKAHEAKAEYEYLKGTLGMCPPPAFRIERNPPKKRLQQELRLLSKNSAFHDIVKSIRKRFWIPLYRTFVVHSPDLQHDDLSDLTEYLWIDLIERVRNLSEGIEIKVGGMDWWENYDEWQNKLIGEKSEELGEAQQGLLRLHIWWLLKELGLPRQYGQALEQYILFGYADPVPAFEIHRGDHHSIYQSGSSLCIEIYDYTQASDITRHWHEVKQAMKQLWDIRGTRPKIAPNLERDFEWYRLVTQEGKSPKEIADALELETESGDIDETIIRSAVNRIKKRLEPNA